jgi:hypothetical protein
MIPTRTGDPFDPAAPDPAALDPAALDPATIGHLGAPPVLCQYVTTNAIEP